MNERINDATGKRNLKERLLTLFSSLMAIMAEQNNKMEENQDGGVGRHTAPPRTTRTDRESNSKGDQRQENRK